MTTYTETGRMEGESGSTTSTKKADAKYPPSKDRVSAKRSGSWVTQRKDNNHVQV